MEQKAQINLARRVEGGRGKHEEMYERNKEGVFTT